MMCKCWEMMPADRPTFAELRSHFEALLEGQHASDYVDFTASLAPIPEQEGGENVEMDTMAAEGYSAIFSNNYQFYNFQHNVCCCRSA